MKVTTKIARSMDIESLNVDQILCGHQINQQRPNIMDITIIGTTTLGRVVTTVRNMDTFLKTTLEHTLVASVVESNHLLQLSKDRTHQQILPNQVKGTQF